MGALGSNKRTLNRGEGGSGLQEVSGKRLPYLLHIRKAEVRD